MTENKAKKLYRIKGETLTLGDLREALVTMFFRDAVNKPATALNDDVLMSMGREIRHFVHRRLHDLQVRSVPIASYANVLRHFYLRVNEIIDIHPGTEQRISLRGWHAETDLGSDRLERRCIACSRCTDACLAGCWRDCRAFNLITRNCDHAFNKATQSVAVANGLALLAFSLTCIAFSSCFRSTGLLILMPLLVFGVIQWLAARDNDAVGLTGVVDVMGQCALRIVFCPHVFCILRSENAPMMS